MWAHTTVRHLTSFAALEFQMPAEREDMSAAVEVELAAGQRAVA
jgi:hypothetical protein